MGNLGAKVSIPGYDVKTVLDQFLSTTSSAKDLKIFKEVAVSQSVPAEDVADLLYTHNLGYYSPVLVVYNGNSIDGTINRLMDKNYQYFFSGNTVTIGIYNDHVSTATYYFTIYVFLDSFDSYTADSIGSTSSVFSTGSDYGLRVSKAGFDVKTCADKDCTVTSKYGSGVVHKIGSTSPGTVNHGLGYIPQFFSYEHYSGDDYIQPPLYLNAYINSSDLVFDDVGQDTNYYVIFKRTF